MHDAFWIIYTVGINEISSFVVGKRPRHFIFVLYDCVKHVPECWTLVLMFQPQSMPKLMDNQTLLHLLVQIEQVKKHCFLTLKLLSILTNIGPTNIGIAWIWVKRYIYNVMKYYMNVSCKGKRWLHTIYQATGFLYTKSITKTAIIIDVSLDIYLRQMCWQKSALNKEKTLLKLALDWCY